MPLDMFFLLNHNLLSFDTRQLSYEYCISFLLLESCPSPLTDQYLFQKCLPMQAITLYPDMTLQFPLVKDIVGYLKMCHSILPIKR